MNATGEKLILALALVVALGLVLLLTGLWLKFSRNGGNRLPQLSSKHVVGSGRLPLVTVAGLGIVLSTVSYFWSHSLQEKDYVAHRITESAVPRAVLLDRAIDRQLEVVQAIGGLYSASSSVERNEFRAFAQRMLARNPNIQALEWIPRLAHSERADHETNAHLDGYTSFRITERNSAGQLVPSATKDVYFPVYFVEPFRGNESAIGFDLGSNPVRLKALLQARDTGEAVATKKVNLVQNPGDDSGILVIVPIYSTSATPKTVELRRERISGFALGVFRIGQVVEAAMQETAGPDDFDIYLLDESAEPPDRLLHYIPSKSRQAVSRLLPEDELHEQSTHSALFDIAGRRWHLLFDYVGGGAGGHFFLLPWGIAVTGVLLTLLLVQYLVWLQNRTKLIEDLVEARSQELIASNASLQAEVADRERVERDLRTSERRFSGILEGSEQAIISIDESQRICIFSQGAEKIFGYQSNEILGQSIERLIPVHLRVGHRKLVEQFKFSTSSSRRMDQHREIAGLRKDGSEFPAEAVVSRIETAGETINTVMLRDITARKQMEEALRASETRFRAIVDNSPAAISMKDLDGRFLLMNDRFREWYCSAAEDPIGKTSFDFYDNQQAKLFADLDKRALDTLQAAEQEFDVVYANGSRHSVVTIKFPIFDADNLVIGIGGVATDVTEQREAEQKLRQNAKMEALGTLAGGIAHDLNNMLVPVMGLTKLVMSQMPEDGQAYKALEKVIDASRRARDLVNQILAFSRADKPKRSPVALKEIVNEVMTFLRSAIPTTIEIRQNIAPKLGLVLADSTQIHQVLMNLASNARYAMQSDGGVLEVTLDSIEWDADTVRDDLKLTPGPYARIIIRDTGEGMNAEIVGRIFDPFFTTKAVGEGTGMGLAVVHGIISRHGGAITVASQEGQGTTFEIYLPIWQGDQLETEVLDKSEAAA